MNDNIKSTEQLKQSFDFLLIASFFLAVVVGIGAFGAHGLKPLLEKLGRVQTFETAVQYHMLHAIGMFLAGLCQSHFSKSFKVPFYLFLVGTFIFSGSLYVLSVTNITWLGMITPLGGVAFIAGWISLAQKFYQLKKQA